MNNLDKTKNTSEIVQDTLLKNPLKYLLYKPTFSQFYAYLTSAFKDLPPFGVLMIYISADSLEISDFNSKNSVERKFMRFLWHFE